MLGNVARLQLRPISWHIGRLRILGTCLSVARQTLAKGLRNSSSIAPALLCRWLQHIGLQVAGQGERRCDAACSAKLVARTQ